MIAAGFSPRHYAPTKAGGNQTVTQGFFMLKFFFSRHCFMVRLMEVLTLAGLGYTLWLAFTGQASFWANLLIGLIVIIYAFLRFCTFWHWYPLKDRSLGIGLQFQKAIIPTAYLLALCSWFFIFTNNCIPLVIAILLLLVIAHVNVILLFLHDKDRDLTPPNQYSMTHG